MELKSTKQKSLPFNNIKNNQLIGLCNASKYPGVQAYFVINFREIEETYSIEAVKIKEYMENTDTKSISLDFCRENGLKIEQELKRSRYRYNLNALLGQAS